MKFDDLLAQYLYENKTLQLQGIGSFTLDREVHINHDNDKQVYYPIEGLSFTYNTKEVTPEELITFLVKKLGKITPLVRSDLDSYLSNIKQFINIGKPYTIEGVGTLSKNNQGMYEFTPGNFLPEKEELSPKRESEHALRSDNTGRNGGRVVTLILIGLALLAVLGAIGWGVYALINNNDKPQTENNVGADELADDTNSINPADTATSQRPAAFASPTDSANFRMIFEVTRNKGRASSRTAQLNTLKINAHYDSIPSATGTQYRIFVTKKLLPADTTRVRDSISKFFLRKVFVEKQ